MKPDPKLKELEDKIESRLDSIEDRLDSIESDMKNNIEDKNEEGEQEQLKTLSALVLLYLPTEEEK